MRYFPPTDIDGKNINPGSSTPVRSHKEKVGQLATLTYAYTFSPKIKEKTISYPRSLCYVVTREKKLAVTYITSLLTYEKHTHIYSSSTMIFLSYEKYISYMPRACSSGNCSPIVTYATHYEQHQKNTPT